MVDGVVNDVSLMVLAITLAWVAGYRAYLAAFALGLGSLLGWVELPAGLEVLQSPWVLAVSGVLTIVEFTADKIPGVDSISDLVNTLVRVPGGALLAAGVMAPDTGELSAAWLAAGAGSALAAHALKSGTRLLINASPEPFSNVATSTVEDAGALSALLLVISYPWVALAIAVSIPLCLALLAVWVVRRLATVRGRSAAPSSR